MSFLAHELLFCPNCALAGRPETFMAIRSMQQVPATDWKSTSQSEQTTLILFCPDCDCTANLTLPLRYERALTQLTEIGHAVQRSTHHPH